MRARNVGNVDDAERAAEAAYRRALRAAQGLRCVDCGTDVTGGPRCKRCAAAKRVEDGTQARAGYTLPRRMRGASR